MRIGFRQLANLAVVVVVGLMATTWAVIELARFEPFAPPKHDITVTLPESGGALEGAEVTYLGVGIGSVEEIHIVDEGVELRLAVRPQGPMAAELRADVRQKTSLGEPYVDLAPATDDATPTEEVDGLVVPVERTSVPPALGELLRDGERLFAAIDPADVDAVARGASGLVGHERDLQRVLAGFGDLGEVVQDRQDELASLLASSAQLTEVLAVHQGELARMLDSGSDLAAVLAQRREQLGDILAQAAETGRSASGLMSDIDEDLDGVLDGLETSVHTLAERPQKVHEILVYTPRFVTELGRTFEGGSAWSSTQTIPVVPWSPTYGLPITGSGLRVDAIVVPQVIERIEIDGDDFPAIILVSPEEAAEAARSAADYRRVQQREIAELEERVREQREER